MLEKMVTVVDNFVDLPLKNLLSEIFTIDNDKCKTVSDIFLQVQLVT